MCESTFQKRWKNRAFWLLALLVARPWIWRMPQDIHSSELSCRLYIFLVKDFFMAQLAQLEGGVAQILQILEGHSGVEAA